MLRFVTVTSVMAGLWLSTSFAASPDWPQFRGPKRDGVSQEKGLLKEWPVEGPKVAWSASGMGRGFSTVAVAGEHIVTMGDLKGSGQEEGCYLIALNREDGKHLWKTRVGKTGGNYEGPRCTPTIDGKFVYGLGQFGDLVCCDLSSGEVVWKKNLPENFGGRSGGWNYTESPLIDGDKLVCTPGGNKATMVALNKKSGEVIWQGVIPGGDTAGYASIVITTVGGVRQYVQLMAGGVAGFSANDGKMLWRYGNSGDRFSGNTANIPTPVVLDDGYIFCAAGYGRGGGLIQVKQAGSEFTVEEVYFKRDFVNKHGGVIVVDGKAYGDKDDSGLPWCADVKTGDIVWKKQKRSEGGGSASITYAEGNLYVRYQNGVMALVKADGDSYEEISFFKIPNPDHSWPHPVVAGGKLYLREQGTLYCYDIAAK